MTVNAESGSHAINGQTLQAVAAWLKTHGPVRRRQEYARVVMLQRYPAGLLSDDELDALTGYFIH